MKVISHLIRRSVNIDIRLLSEFDKTYVPVVHRLLQTSLGSESVEDMMSFKKSISRTTDPEVKPTIICALIQDKPIGVLVGSYLRELNMGFICYGAIDEEWRNNGIYSVMRSLMKNLFIEEAGTHELEFIISEMSKSSILYANHVTRKISFKAPGHYEQPGVQGLQAKPMKLIIQPVSRCELPRKDELIKIINVIYNRIYRVTNVSDNISFKRIAKSLS